MKILTIVETPYRAIIEEQDDAAFWLSHAVKNASGAEFSILLRGNAVNYAVKDQDPTGLEIGGVPVTRPCKPHEDLATMAQAGMRIQVVRDDLEALGIPLDRVVTDVELIGREQVAAVVELHDQVWHF